MGFKIVDFEIFLGRKILASIFLGSLIYSQIRYIALRVANFEWVFLFRQSFEWGAELMLITMRSTRLAGPAKTKLRMTLDCLRIAKEMAMMRGLFVEVKRRE